MSKNKRLCSYCGKDLSKEDTWAETEKGTYCGFKCMVRKEKTMFQRVTYYF
jgi:DNA-directed RNA polymerase subunit RPC12/RpoP